MRISYLTTAHSLRQGIWAGILMPALCFWSSSTPAVMEHMASGLNRQAALKYSQAVIGQKLGHYSLTDTNGKPVDLDDFRGKPLILSLIYTSCHHVCPMLTSHLNQVADVARDALGKNSFNVVSIGFDTAVDTPERMREFAHSRGVTLPNWYFLSTNADTILRLAKDTGFIFEPSPKGFDHLAQITLVTADGKIDQQVYGAQFAPPTLIEPLKELVFGTPNKTVEPSGWLNRVRLFCTLYDPASGRYRFDYSIFITIIIGVFSLGGVAIFLVRSWRESSANDRTGK